MSMLDHNGVIIPRPTGEQQLAQLRKEFEDWELDITGDSETRMYMLEYLAARIELFEIEQEYHAHMLAKAKRN